ncbi:GerMN domain-containing protein [Paenibacillus sp. N1-5-1-14]|uniref:GerMN domain-containing protein n=1 Tax=Paenibacillus radicibacter TaxID=2972488 RepID=UPI0021590193|nr:GerMN domain-containing protein [Paenibacillus radicibacter]MCR8641693.1 GerMN domain-containing protein [Paenibacillus radicibacter]
MNWKGFALILTIALMIAGCGQKQALQGNVSTSTPVPTVEPTQTPTPTPTATPIPKKTKQVKVYYSDDNLEELVEKVATITYLNDGDLYHEALEKLKKSDDPKLTSLFEKVTFKHVTMEKDGLHVDLTWSQGGQMGAPGEDFFIKALEKTVFQFPEVKALYVKKDGNQVESLMGHMDLPYPIVRSAK